MNSKHIRWVIFIIVALFLLIVGGYLVMGGKSGEKPLNDVTSTPPTTKGPSVATTIVDTGAIPTVEGTVISTPKSGTNILDFKTKGMALINLKNGQTFETPLNTLLYKDYSDLVLGFPFESSYEKIKSIEFNRPESSYNEVIDVIITYLDGSKSNKNLFSSSVSVLGVNDNGKFEIDIKDINRIDFQHTTTKIPIIRIAKIEPKNGDSFRAPADIIILKENSISMGVFTQWRDGLPLSGGNVLSFREIKHLEILETSSGINGWSDRIKVQITLLNGEVFTDMIQDDTGAFFIYGVNRLGVFNLDMNDKLKSISFD